MIIHILVFIAGFVFGVSFFAFVCGRKIEELERDAAEAEIMCDKAMKIIEELEDKYANKQ